jgi:hypothetical protein
MKVWQRSKKETDFGRVLLIWRHRASGRFFSKIFSWLLGGFVMGLLASILFDTIGLEDQAIHAGRIVFFAVFIIGVISAFFRNLVYGLHYRITQKALLHIRPLCGIEAWSGAGKCCFLDDRTEYLPWEQIKSVDESEGNLVLTLKDDNVVNLGVVPVRALWVPTADGSMEKRAPAKGMWSRSAQLDKEALKLVLQKAREIKKAAATKS